MLRCGPRSAWGIACNSIQNGASSSSAAGPEDAAGSKVDDRAVLGNESTRGPDLIKMSEHDRIHVGKHDPPRAQIMQPQLEHVPGDVAGQFAGIGEAFDHKEIGASGDGDERVHPLGVAGIGKAFVAVESTIAVEGAPE